MNFFRKHENLGKALILLAGLALILSSVLVYLPYF